MLKKLIGWLIRPIKGKLYAKSYYETKRKGKFNFDNWWIEFVDPETLREYIIRPSGMPLPKIVDELINITGSLESAMDLYKKFCAACNATSKKYKFAFKITVSKPKEIIK